jgi:hypothetical protein
MRHFCQRVLFLLLIATVGCNDSTGPTLPATFELADINGRDLPTYLSPTPGLSPTVLSAYLLLDNAGRASWLERRRAFDGTETTIALTFAYIIRGNQIDLGPTEPCPPNANCISFSGSISKDALSLVVVQLSINGPIVYNYRVTAGIPATS